MLRPAVSPSLVLPRPPCAGTHSASGRRFIAAAWAAPLAVFPLLWRRASPVVGEDAAQTHGDQPRGARQVHRGPGSACLGVSPRQAAGTLAGFIVVFFFAFAFQMLNKVSGVSRGLCPSPTRRAEAEAEAGAHLLRRVRSDLAAPWVLPSSRAGRGRDALPRPLHRGRGGVQVEEEAAPSRERPAELPRAWLGPRDSGARASPEPRAAALCAVSSPWRGGGPGGDASQARMGALGVPASPSLAALSPLRRCWPGWGSPASGALWTCWGWRRTR